MKMVKAQSQNKFIRVITTPYRVLIRARDFYVQSMTNCAGTVSYGGTMPNTMPRSFSVSSSRSNDNDDFRELVRVASVRTMGSGNSNKNNNRLDVDALLKQQQEGKSTAGLGLGLGSKGLGAMRSVSVGMGKIDEEQSCEDFVGGDQENSVKAKNGLLYPRSKSYAVNKRSLVF